MLKLAKKLRIKTDPESLGLRRAHESLITLFDQRRDQFSENSGLVPPRTPENRPFMTIAAQNPIPSSDSPLPKSPFNWERAASFLHDLKLQQNANMDFQPSFSCHIRGRPLSPIIEIPHEENG